MKQALMRLTVCALIVAACWAWAVVMLALDVGATVPRPDPYGCERTYTRAHFHNAARSTYRTAFPPARKVRTLNRVQRCQRYRRSLAVVREHRGRYRHAWRQRFYFQHAWARVPAWLKGTLAAIASCESGGSPTAVSDTGQYRGKYQFDYGTWREVGGSGDPAAAPEVEQDVRAAALYLKAGARRWPTCGR